jgi:hypothetical protein
MKMVKEASSKIFGVTVGSPFQQCEDGERNTD